MTSEHHSITGLIPGLKAGDQDAANEIVRRFFGKCLQLAEEVYRKKFHDVPRPAEGEEDAVQDALATFCARAKEQGFADLDDRNDVWMILATITFRKICKQRKRAMAKCRDGKNLREEGLDGLSSELPGPETLAELRETWDAAFALLDDPELQKIAQMDLRGSTREEIARELGITERTVYRKRKRVIKKWQQHFRTSDQDGE
jgi:DNA-directed RNA polymerase specialized sigma24 family protein